MDIGAAGEGGLTFAAMPKTRLASLHRPAGLLVLAVLVVSIVVLLALALRMDTTVPTGSVNAGDRATYDRILAHMRDGQDYYAATRVELIRGHYGMQSVFNWRTPLLASILAAFPSIFWPQAGLVALAVLAAGLTTKLVFDALGPIAAGVLVIVEIVSLGACFVPDTVVFAEVPVGVLILLSAAAYGTGWRKLGLGAAVLALFLRELAAPYALICLWLAFREKRYGECRAWLVALAGYAAYFLWHFSMVRAHQQAGDLGDPHGWVQFGGAGFLLATGMFNGLFFAGPPWLTALFMPLAVLGALAWPGRAGDRIALAVAGYLAVFSVVGQHFNVYWGAMYTPLMSVGIVWAPAVLRDLWQAVRRPAAGPAKALQPGGGQGHSWGQGP